MNTSNINVLTDNRFYRDSVLLLLMPDGQNKWCFNWLIKIWPLAS